VDLNKHLSALSLPAEFASADNQTILAYLRELMSSSTSEIYRMRIMIVGPGNVGKTTLVQRLLHDNFDPGQFCMTDGVSMKKWKLAADMNLSLWDFGGQQVYLNTHTMLFSDKTLYCFQHIQMALPHRSHLFHPLRIRLESFTNVNKQR
jgi:GTPase SAR1 family protein